MSVRPTIILAPGTFADVENHRLGALNYPEYRHRREAEARRRYAAELDIPEIPGKASDDNGQRVLGWSMIGITRLPPPRPRRRWGRLLLLCLFLFVGGMVAYSYLIHP